MILNELFTLSELSPDTLASYKKKAGADASAADAAGNYARGNKRFKGIVKATKKQFANDTKGVAEGAAKFDPKTGLPVGQQLSEFGGDATEFMPPTQSTPTTEQPPRRGYSIMLTGKPGRDWMAEYAWQALEKVFPREYPGNSSVSNYSGDKTVTPAMRKVLEVANRGSAVAKTGITSEDIAETLVAKLAVNRVPAEYWRITSEDLDEGVTEGINDRGFFNNVEQWHEAKSDIEHDDQWETPKYIVVKNNDKTVAKWSKADSYGWVDSSEQGVAEGGAGSGRVDPLAWDTTSGKVGRVEKTATGIRHHADPSRYGGTEPSTEINKLDKSTTSATDKALGVKWDRESKRYYSPIKVDEEGTTNHAELAKMAHDAYVAATRKGNGPMAAHYLKQHMKHKADAAKAKSGVAEAADPESQKFGKYIKKYFGQIYDYGDDGLEYLDNNAPFWAMLFDKHDGDIDYIIAMEPADVLKKAALELKAVAGDLKYELDEQGVAEGLDQPREAGKAIQSLKNLAVMKSALTMQQLTQAGREAIVSNAINAAKTLEQSYLQNKQQGNAIFVRALRDEIDNFMRGAPINASFPETDTASELGELLQGKLGKVNFQQGVAEGLPQTLRKVVPGYAKREIDKKMDDQKFGRTDVDKDANYYRYKKIQDKLKGVAEDYNGEYDDEAGLADNNLETLARAVEGIDDLINTGDNLPEWCQEKIAVAKSMLVAVWDYMESEQESEDNELQSMMKSAGIVRNI